MDGNLEISNNRAERSIKPFVIGRKNWMHCNTPNGARASAVYYSIIISAIENRLNPYEYLAWVFKNAPNLGRNGYPSDIEELLPFGPGLPDGLFVPARDNQKQSKQAWEED